MQRAGESNTQKGFTLIELLVVIAIIGLLSSVVIASLNTARAGARDAKRLQDMSQVRTALELYYNANGRYPIQPSWTGTSQGCYSGTANPNDSIPGLAPTYIGSVPTDPNASGNSCYLYRSNASGSDYKFLVHNTVEAGVIPAGAPNARCPAHCSQSYCTQRSYAVYTSGLECW